MDEWGQEGWVAGVGDGSGRSGGDGRFKPRFTWQKKEKIKPTEKPSKQPGDGPSPRQEERQKPKLKKWGFEGEG